MSIISSRRRAQRRAHVVVARRQAVDPELSQVVRLRDAPGGGREAAPAVLPCLAHGRHRDVGNRVAELVDDAPGDDAAARHADVRIVEALLVGELDGLARLERPRLPVLDVDEPRLGRLQREAAGRQLAELEAALGVGERRLWRDVRARDADLRPADWPGAIAREHAPADAAGAGLELYADRPSCPATGSPRRHAAARS